MMWIRNDLVRMRIAYPTYQIFPDQDPTLKPGQQNNWKIVSAHNGTANGLLNFLKISK